MKIKKSFIIKLANLNQAYFEKELVSDLFHWPFFSLNRT